MKQSAQVLTRLAIIAGLAGVASPAMSVSIPSYDVYFPADFATLDADQINIIQVAANVHRSNCPRQRLYLFAGTDTVGTAANNMERSAAYADAVAGRLTALGVPASLIFKRPTGEVKLNLDTPDETAEPLNRHVHIAFGEDNLFQDCDPPLGYPSN